MLKKYILDFFQKKVRQFKMNRQKGGRMGREKGSQVKRAELISSSGRARDAITKVNLDLSRKA